MSLLRTLQNQPPYWRGVAVLMASLGVMMLSAVAAQLIPVDRTFGEAWQNAGYPGVIPSPTKIVNVKSFGAVGDGVADEMSAVNAAINSLNGTGGVVYFPAGTYLLHSTVNVPGGVVLRGESSQTTKLLWDQLGSGIYIGASQSGTFQPVASGYTIHSSIIVVTNGAVFAPGDYAEIREDNDPAWGITASWAGKAAGQILKITAVSGNTLTLERPLRFAYLAGQNPEIRKISPITGAGVENLKIERLIAGTNTTRNNVITITFESAARCWVRGVEGNYGFGGHVAFYGCTQCEVTGCYFHDAADYDGGGSGYGVRLESKTGECLIENNIFRSLRHAVLFQVGSNGNVVGYNYSRESKNEFGFITSDITFHGTYTYGNLVEGNVCRFISIDDSGSGHGANGPHNTIFRNRTEGSGISIASNGSNNQNIVGNEIATGSYSFGGSGHFSYGNNRSSGVTPAGTTSLTDYSYYLTSDPSVLPALPTFWNIASAYPSIGIPLVISNVKSNPASARYSSGANFTLPPGLDADGDGMADVWEGMFGTDANNAGSAYQITTTLNGSNQPLVGWPGVNGRSYRVDYCDTLGSAWQTLAYVSATSATASYTDTTTPAPAKRFYRVTALY